MIKVYGEGCVRQVTGAYLDGINEGRQFLRANPWLTLKDMQDCMNNAKINMSRHNDLMRDYFKGECDFWRNQIKQA